MGLAAVSVRALSPGAPSLCPMRIALLSLLLAAPALAQPQTGCDAEATAGLAFWVGSWDLAWEGPNPGTGTNEIALSQNGCVVHERFSAATGYAGESWSVPTASGWRQTWVDNQRGYLTFTGETDASGRVTAMRQPPFTNGQCQTQYNRMVWQDVTDDGLTWRWQASTDGGATWTDNWVIRYTRAD